MKHFITYGDGSERLEELMNEWAGRRPSNWEAYGKYLQMYDDCQRGGRRTPLKLVEQVHRAFAKTFASVKDAELASLYQERFEETWPMMRAHIIKNPAIAYYYLDKVVNSVSFYDAMRRILDPTASGASVLEASYGVTWDVLGKYGPLELDDPSTKFDVFSSMMNFARARCYVNTSVLMELADRGGAKIFAGGFGLGPECRHFDISLKQLRNLQITAVDREVHESELDEVFNYAHGVDFAGTGIKLYQDDVVHFVKTHLDLYGQMDYAYMMGVLSYCKSDHEMCDLMDAALMMLRPGARFDFDLQTVDDFLRLAAKIFGWSEQYPLRPEPNPEVAIDRVRRVCRMCGAELNDCTIDQRNDPPIGVIFSVSRG